MLANHGAGEDSKILESKIKLINPKGNYPEYSLEGLISEAETPTLWPPDGKK